MAESGRLTICRISGALFEFRGCSLSVACSAHAIGQLTGCAFGEIFGEGFNYDREQTYLHMQPDLTC